MEAVVSGTAEVVTLVASVRVNGSGRPLGERTAEVDFDGCSDVAVERTVAGVNAGLVVVNVVHGAVVSVVVVRVVALVSNPRVTSPCFSSSS